MKLAMRYRQRGFTLVELLVVIVIIALLISLLLPALKNARNLARNIKSQSNCRQINIAGGTYREDNHGFMPLAMTAPRGNKFKPTDPGGLAWCTWSYGGKNPEAYWYTRSGGVFDVEAADRLINPYVYPEVRIHAPTPPTRMPPTDPNRTSLQLEVFRDPGDFASYQRSASFHTNPTPGTLSSYDDVGTSYHFNVKWWDQIPNGGSRFYKAFEFGCHRLRLSDAFQPSRMVWIHDQFSDVIANNNSANFKLRNGFNDINRSVMGFMDGHVGYHPVYPGDLPKSYSNHLYTFIFDDLRLPHNW